MGRRIAEEFGGASADMLTHWMAQRIAELMEHAEQVASVEEREQARAACTDVILRLWERRAHWPYGAPLHRVASALDALVGDLPMGNDDPKRPAEPREGWLGAIDDLSRLHEREHNMVRTAALADISLEEERTWVETHGTDMNADERAVLEQLVTEVERLRGADVRLDGQPMPHFAAMPAHERHTRVMEALHRIDEERRKLFQSVEASEDMERSAEQEALGRREDGQ